MNALMIVKILVSASILVLAAELSKRSSLAAAITLALPITSLLAILWMRFESHDPGPIISLSWNIFWLVPPSLVFFPLFATLLGRNVPFWAACLLSAGLTVALYLLYAKILGAFGIKI